LGLGLGLAHPLLADE